MEIDYFQVEKLIDAISPAVVSELQRILSKYLDKSGLYYRIFSRLKSGQSAVKKIKEKGYPDSGRLMQDLVGIRATLYFQDDVDICISIIRQNFEVSEIVQDPVEIDTFRPVRLNIVCKMPDTAIRMIDSTVWELPIDKTFEIQLRTVFSEGWHEIEHDLRYKSQKDWDGFTDLSRSFNGIFAVLETCDWSILKILDELSYEKYKRHDWLAMIKNHYRIRIEQSELDSEVTYLLDHDLELAKKVFRANRAELLLFLSSNKTSPFPKNLNNIIYIINALSINNADLLEITPDILKKQVENYLQDRAITE